eukprot:6208861-Pleurochrysis_carterae.AAC.2
MQVGAKQERLQIRACRFWSFSCAQLRLTLQHDLETGWPPTCIHASNPLVRSDAGLVHTSRAICQTRVKLGAERGSTRKPWPCAAPHPTRGACRLHARARRSLFITAAMCSCASTLNAECSVEQ